MNAKLIQVYADGQPFSFTVGETDIVSIKIESFEKDFINFSILIKEPDPIWRHFTHSGNYMVEWNK